MQYQPGFPKTMVNPAYRPAIISDAEVGTAQSYTGQPARFLPQMAKRLGVTVDQILGAEPMKAVSPKEVRLWRKLKEVNRLPPKDQKAVIYYIDALLTKQEAGS